MGRLQQILPGRWIQSIIYLVPFRRKHFLQRHETAWGREQSWGWRGRNIGDIDDITTVFVLQARKLVLSTRVGSLEAAKKRLVWHEGGMFSGFEKSPVHFHYEVSRFLKIEQSRLWYEVGHRCKRESSEAKVLFCKCDEHLVVRDSVES